MRQQEVQAREGEGMGEMEDVLTPDEKEKAESVKRKIEKWVLGSLVAKAACVNTQLGVGRHWWFNYPSSFLNVEFEFACVSG